MVLVYDIEVWEHLNMVGFYTVDGDHKQAFWVVYADGLPSETRKYKGYPVYINSPEGKGFINAAITEQRWGVPYGFNNHAYDDYIITVMGSLPCDNIKQLSDTVITQKPHSFFDWPSFDAKEQLPPGFSLKKFESMAGLMVDESDIAFDYPGLFDNEMLNHALEYNLFDLEATAQLVKTRKNYFHGKELLVKEYGYPGSERYSNGSISARYIMGNDRLETYPVDHHKIKMTGVPGVVASFLEQAFIDSPYVSRGKTKAEQSARKKGKVTKIFTEAHGLVYSWGWGGLHGAMGHIQTSKRGIQKPVYDIVDETGLEQWDAKSMFPNLIIRDSLLGPYTAKYQALVIERLKNKAAGLALAATQKVVINSVYGLLRLMSSRLYNPEAAIHVNVAGMVAIYNLADRLSKYAKIIQVNTDGVLLKPNQGVNKRVFDGIRNAWEAEFGLELEVDSFDNVIQKDVNNYIAVDGDHLKVKGVALNRALKQDVLKNVSPRIVQVAVLNQLLGIAGVEETIRGGHDVLDYCFTLSVLRGKSQTGYTVDLSATIPKRLDNRVNRVYAALNGHRLAKERTGVDDNGNKTLLAPGTFADSPEQMGVCNQPLDRDKLPSDLDFDYYIRLSEQKLALWK